MTLVLRNREFEIEQASLSGAIVDPYWRSKYHPHGDPSLSWGLNVEAQKLVFDGENWWPRVYHDYLRFAVRRWTEIAGQVVEWQSAWNGAGGPNGAFYVFEHEGISNAVMHFVKRDGVRFQVSWNGFCDVLWDEEYGRDVPFAVDAWATFTEIRVLGSEFDTAASMRARLGQYLEVTDFVQHEIRQGGSYEDGVRMVSAVFTPRGG